MREGHCHSHDCVCDHEGKASPVDWIRMAGCVVFALVAMFIRHPTVSILLWCVAYGFVGSHIIDHAVRDLINKHPFTENMLMSMASLAAFFIGEHMESVAVLLFYQIGEMVQGLSVRRSRSAIKALLDIRPDKVCIEGRGMVAWETVKRGNVAVVRPGERIPIDGIIISGETTVDTSSLTGESLPRPASIGDPVIGGFMNLSGLIRVRASGPSADSTLSRILHVVEESEQRKSKAQSFISRFAFWYTPIVTVAALCTALVPILICGYDIEYIYRAAVFLTISCPCALVISIPIGYYGGIGGASRQGILCKGANYLEQIGHVSTVIFDKTGTLTTGEFSIKEILPAADIDSQMLMSVCSALEQHSNHPLAQAIKRKKFAYAYTVEQAIEIAGYGVRALVNKKVAIAGNAEFLQKNNISVPNIDTVHVVIHVAWDEQYLGAILVGDTVKESAKSAIPQLRKLGIKRIAMLTGDRQATAAMIAEELQLDSISAQLLPDEKVSAYEKMAQDITVFVGDGINDAPVLARADVGVAMGGLGSDVAIETADMVIMDDNLEKLARAIRISRRTRRLVIENIVLALSVKAVVMILGLMGQMWLWLAIVADTGVALLTVLNSLRALRAK